MPVVFSSIKCGYYNTFFNRFKIRREYEGTNIPRLIETRWSGHSKATECISKNYTELLAALKKISEGGGTNIDAEDVALAVGIANAITDKKFIFLLCFMCELLGVIEPANRLLQSREVGFRKAMPIIDAVMEKLVGLRTDE